MYKYTKKIGLEIRVVALAATGPITMNGVSCRESPFAMETAHENAESHALVTKDCGANRFLVQDHHKVVMGPALEPRPKF